MILGKYRYKITDKEYKSGENIAKKLARKYYNENNYYTYEEYLSTAYYGLSRAIKYYDSGKASFARVVYICCEQDLAMMINTIDKKYNQRKREFEPKIVADYSLNEVVKTEKNSNSSDNTLEDLVGDKRVDYTYIEVKDYIHTIFDSFYENINPKMKRFKVNKDRDIELIKLIVKGYTVMEASNIIGISNQLANSIIKKFRNYAIENNLKYNIN